MYFQDITERKRAVQEIRQSEDQLKAILQNVAEGITAQDPSGQIIYANETAARVGGFASARELLEAPRPVLIPRGWNSTWRSWTWDCRTEMGWS